MKIYVTGPNVEHVATHKIDIKSRLQNEILTASIAQEIEKMEIRTGGRKKVVNANEETRGKEKG